MSTPLRLQQCPGCDYSLEALPDEGICPECGRPYDRTYIILTGRGRGNFDHMSGGTNRWNIVWLIVIVAACIVFSKGGIRIANDPIVWIYGVMFLITLVSQVYARLFSVREAHMQLWLSDVGFAQVASTPEARRANWISNNAWWFAIPVVVAAPMLDRSLRHDRSAWIVVVVFVLMCLPAVRSLAVLRGLLQWERSTAGAPPLTSWRDVERHEIDTIDAQRTRVRLWRMVRWGPISVQLQPAADIELSGGRDVINEATHYIYGNIAAS